MKKWWCLLKPNGWYAMQILTDQIANFKRVNV